MAGDEIFSGSYDGRGTNGRLLNSGSENPYESRGAGIAPVFQTPDGSRPQDQIQPISTPRWNDHATQGQQNLDALASRNEAQVKLFEAANSNGVSFMSSTKAGAVADAETATHRQSDHSVQSLAIPGASLAAAVYSQLIHPPLQHALIHGQLKADALDDAGKLTRVQKALQSPRRSFLQTFSSPYLVHREVRQIASAEDSVRQNLGTMKQDAQAHIEALQLKGGAVKELKKLASSEPNEFFSAEDIQKANRQVKYLEDIKESRSPGQTLSSFLPGERARLNFLKVHNDYLPGGSSSDTHLNWTEFSESMKKSNAFLEHQINPVVDLAAKEKPYYQLGKMKLSRTELQSFSKGMEDLSVSDFFKNSDKWAVASTIGQRFIRSGLIIGAESAVQCALSDAFASHAQGALARIVQPTIPGAFLKSTALLCGATPAMKRATFAGAQLYELESNMTPLERFGTISAGLLPSAILMARGSRGLAMTLGAADMMIGGAAQIASAFKSDGKVADTGHGNYVADRLTAHAQDRSQTAMTADVQWLKNIGQKDPYGLTNIFDDAHKRESLSNPDSPLDYKAEKFRNQIVIGEALGETILNHGLTTSQYSKLMNPKAPLDVPIDRKEEFQIAQSEHIDIGGRAVLTLMGAIGSANMLENTLAQKPSVSEAEIDAVEKQKQVMVEEVNHLLNDSHSKDFESVLKNENYSMFKPANEYNLIQFWKHDPDKYSHLYTRIRDTARDYSEHIPRMQEALNAAQSLVESENANPQSNTSILASEKMLEARKYALNTTIALTAKLYRDEALMELGQAQCYVQNSKNVPGESAKAISVLGNAATALHNSELFAPGNVDCAQLGADTTAVYQAAKSL